MSPSVLPLIAESDYPLFQRMIHDLLHTSYEEWADDHKKAVAYRMSRNGSTEVPLSAVEFEWWLKENRQTAHLELLWACAEDKAAKALNPPRRFMAS